MSTKRRKPNLPHETPIDMSTESKIPEHMFQNKAFVGLPAPAFEAEAVMPDGQFGTVSNTDFAGQYMVLYFYPLDFTFVCPTEILAFSAKVEEFKKLNCALVGVSIDSKFSHYAWTQQSPDVGGIGQITYPLAADLTKKMSIDYGVLMPNGDHSLRGLFIIDKKGIVRHITKNDPPVGRSVDECLRLVKGYQFNDEHGEVCPEGWTPGADTIIDNPQDKVKFFAKNYKA